MRIWTSCRRVASGLGNIALNPSKRIVCATAMIAVLGAALPAAAGAGNRVTPARGARWTWPKNAHVLVRVSDDFCAVDGALPALESAFQKWEEAGAADANGSGVTFDIETVERSTPAPFTYNVAYGRVRQGGQARTMMLSTPAGVFIAWTVVDDRVTDPVALAHVVAHEIGHTFGLAECDSCEPGTSVMTRFNGDYDDVTSGRNGPSDADNAAVRLNGGY